MTASNISSTTGNFATDISQKKTPRDLIRPPEVCANLCFGGATPNRLFMSASQSLYGVYVGISGAHIR